MKVTMKSLSLAVAALTGFGMASATFAACPTIPAGTSTPGGGGAWTSQTVTSAVFGSHEPGLNGTSCALSVAINNGAASNTKGFVTDTSPQNESRYRARFYVDTSALTNLNLSNRQFRVFSGLATTGPGTVGSAAEMVIANIVGGPSGALTVRFQVGDTSVANVGYKIISALVPTNVPANNGKYRVEFDLQQGTTAGANCASVTPTGGCFRYWISYAADATADATPTGTQAVTNTGWSGMKQVNLGMFGTSATFRANVATQPVIVDEFDSRRQTFIGQ
jgi:hypothetical protein